MYAVLGFVALLRLAVLVSGQNMLRFACSQLSVDRSDPIAFPGKRFTPHLHQIVGGNSFNLTMDPKDHDMAGKSTCTSCSFAQDFSNYWTAVMFFHHKNGSVIRVPQVGNGGPQGKLANNGGFDVYYIPSGKTTAFSPGFRMVVGSATNTDPNKVSKADICHRCWTSTNENTFVGGAACTGADTVEIPKDPRCKMIRQTLTFPACWDGKNLDSADHQSHVAYGQGSGANGGGACPSTHPVKLPQLMYELMWNVTTFTDQSMWPTDGSPPFTYSMGIGGAAAHGDYIFGWKGDSLQKAMDNGCNLNSDCPKAGLTAQTPAQYDACTLRQYSPEPVNGCKSAIWLEALPLGDK